MRRRRVARNRNAALGHDLMRVLALRRVIGSSGLVARLDDARLPKAVQWGTRLPVCRTRRALPGRRAPVAARQILLVGTGTLHMFRRCDVPLIAGTARCVVRSAWSALTKLEGRRVGSSILVHGEHDGRIAAIPLFLCFRGAHAGVLTTFPEGG